MSDLQTRKVTIGGNQRTVPPVNTRKLVLGTLIWSRLQRHLNDAMMEVARFSDSYRQLNKLTVTPGRGERFGLSPEDFNGHAFLEIPMPPETGQQLAVGFAYVFERSEDDVLRLCALVLASKDELRDHRKAGDLDVWLLEQGNALLDEADEPEDLIEVMIEVVRQFKGRKRLEDAVKNLRREFSNPETPGDSQDEASDSSTGTEAQHQRMDALVGEDKPATWSAEAENPPSTPSSTSSPADTTGLPTTSSMSSPGQT